MWPNCIFNRFTVFALRIPMQATCCVHAHTHTLEHTHTLATKSGLTISVELTIKFIAAIFDYSHFKCTSPTVFVGMRMCVGVQLLLCFSAPPAAGWRTTKYGY